MEIDIHFDNNFEKYSSIKDKFDSLYIFVIYKLDFESSYEKVSKIINIIDSMSDVKKKSYLKNRLHNFREYLKMNYNLESLISGIFMVSDDVKLEVLTPYHAQTLDMFSHNKLSYEYDCMYPIDWLKKLLLDRTYINVIKIKNNDVTHIKLNSTKKHNVNSSTIKSMNLAKIVEDLIPKGEPYLIHGVSSVLKNYVDKNALAIRSVELTDEMILGIVSSVKILEYKKELEQILDRLLDPKFGSKIVFGKDIKISIQNSLLKTLYCTDTVEKQLVNIPCHLKNFDVRVIKRIECGDIADRMKIDDIYNRLDKNFSGAVGIKYY